MYTSSIASFFPRGDALSVASILAQIRRKRKAGMEKRREFLSAGDGKTARRPPRGDLGRLPAHNPPQTRINWDPTALEAVQTGEAGTWKSV